MPTKAQIKGAKTRVIVLEVDVSSADIAKKAKLGKVIRNKTESLLSDAGVKVVDRKLAKKLQKEIQLAEIKGNHGYKGPEIADFSVTGQVVFSNFSTRYSAASRWVDKKGKAHYVPAKCHYKAEIEATLKIHALPSLDLVDTIKKDKGFAYMKTVELVRREWELEGRKVRPITRMNESLSTT